MKSKGMKIALVIVVIVAVAFAVYFSPGGPFGNSATNTAPGDKSLAPSVDTCTFSQTDISCTFCGDGSCSSGSNLPGGGNLGGAISGARFTCDNERNRCIRSQESEAAQNAKSCQWDSNGNPRPCTFSSTPVLPWGDCTGFTCTHETDLKKCTYSSVTYSPTTGKITLGGENCWPLPGVLGDPPLDSWECTSNPGGVNMDFYTCKGSDVIPVPR